MKAIRFTFSQGGTYVSNHTPSRDGSSENLSGLYVRAEIAEQLVNVLTKFTAWNKKYPSSKIYSEAQIRIIARELDAINEEAIAALAKIGEQPTLS